MLLSIDRVLQLLAEGKSIEKIAEMAGAGAGEVCLLIKEARRLLLNLEGEKTKRKIIIKKKDTGMNSNSIETNPKSDEIFNGAELSAVPLGSLLTAYTDGASSGNPGPAGIGIVINDKDDRTVGKVSTYIGANTNNFAEYTAIIRAMKIAIYFKTHDFRIRTDSELAVKQIKGEYKISSDKIRPLYEQVMSLKKQFNSFKIDHIPRSQNEKADFLAKSAITGKK